MSMRHLTISVPALMALDSLLGQLAFNESGSDLLAFYRTVHAEYELAESTSIYDEIRAERERAHAKHGNTSMEAWPADSLSRLAILLEEVGEVAKEFNDARHDGREVDFAKLRAELVQVATMAAAWADRIEAGS